MKLKDFEKFLEEITIKGNPAIPGEGEFKDEENPYLSDVERRAKERLQITGAQTGASLGGKLMALLSQSKEYVKGKEKKLEDLASEVMEIEFGWILDRYTIELDIKFIEGSKIQKFMDDVDEEENPEAEVEFREITDVDLRSEIHKRKIVNLIIQGHAKNIKHILHSDTVKNGLNRIYGAAEAEKIFKIWDEMTKTADKLDWIIPTDARSKMMEQNPDGFAGACGYGWKKTEKESEEITEEPEEDYTEWTGEEDEESYYDEGGGVEEFVASEEFNFTPIMRARGVDFPMLLHESVKGLFELLGLGSIPSDPRTAGTVISQTGLSDEPEDWKYGPEIARDFRAFLNKNKNIDKYPNVREELFKKLVDKDTMPTDEFLTLFRGILSDRPTARKKIDKMIDEIIESIEEIEEYNRQMEEYEREMEEYNRKMAEWEESHRTMGSQEEQEEEEVDIEEVEEVQEIDPSKMTQLQLQKLIDDALDRRDIATVKKLSKYLKEGREIYLREVEMILENKNRHR